MRFRVLAAFALFGALASPHCPLAQSAPSVETLLYQAADALGMLRTPSEVDRIVTMIYSGTGTMLVDGQTCALEHYRASVRYPIPDVDHTFPVPGMRVDFGCATDNGEPERHVRVVAGFGLDRLKRTLWEAVKSHRRVSAATD